MFFPLFNTTFYISIPPLFVGPPDLLKKNKETHGLALAFKPFGTSFRGTSAMTKAFVPRMDQGRR